MILDFWTTNLNPVTMMSRELDHVHCQKGINYIYTQEDLNENSNFISLKKAMQSTGVGIVILRRLLKEKNPRYSSFMYKKTVFFEIKDFSKIEIVFKEKFVIPEEYISSKELKNFLGIDTMQLWTLAQKMKWTKKKFKGNISYYLKKEVLKL